MQRTWAGALAALLTLVIAVAPLAAPIAMSANADAAPRARSSNSHIHDHDARDRRSGVLPLSHAVQAAHSHKTDDSGHRHPAGHHQHHHHQHDGDVADTGVPLTLMSHHEHGDGPDAGCCGTFCHSVFFLTGSPYLAAHAIRASFPCLHVQRLTAVDPDQLQRPPARLLSL
jgi:hypothetical protein